MQEPIPAERDAVAALGRLTASRSFSLRAVLCVVAGSCCLLVGIGVFAKQPRRSTSLNQLNLTEAERVDIIRKHKFVLLGGPHGGGSSLLWKLLESHASVSAFHSKRAAFGQLSEGLFLQSAISSRGIYPESTLKAPVQQDLEGGLGRYALHKTSHLTEHHSLNSNATSLKLLSEWGYHWNLSQPVLLDKTPSHMLGSRLMHSLLAPSATFIFVTRHPLSVALTHRHWVCCKQISLAELHLHWIASHRALALDVRHLPLHEARIIRYEDLTLHTRACLTGEVLPWLQLSADVDIPRRMAMQPNAKHEEHLCHRLLDTAQKVHRHCAMTAALQPAIDRLGLGYNIQRGGQLGFGCLTKVFENSSLLTEGQSCHTTTPTPWIVKSLEKQWMMTHFGGSKDVELMAGKQPSLEERMLCTRVAIASRRQSKKIHVVDSDDDRCIDCDDDNDGDVSSPPASEPARAGVPRRKPRRGEKSRKDAKAKPRGTKSVRTKQPKRTRKHRSHPQPVAHHGPSSDKDSTEAALESAKHHIKGKGATKHKAEKKKQNKKIKKRNSMQRLRKKSKRGESNHQGQTQAEYP